MSDSCYPGEVMIVFKEIKWKSEYCDYILSSLPLLMYSLWIMIMHVKLHLWFADDVHFRSYSQIDGYTLLGWMQERYLQWSSRILIDGAVVTVSAMPGVIWRVINSILLIETAMLLSWLFIPREKKLLGNILLVSLLCGVDYGIMHSTGWISTSINYVWPLAGALLGIVPIKKIYQNSTIRGYEYIVYLCAVLFSVCSEQVCICLCIVYASFLLFEQVMKRTLSKYIILLGIISGIGFINILICPGNKSRTIQETARWLPEFADYSAGRKVLLGISSTIRFVFSDKNISFWILVCLIALVVVVGNYSLYKKICGVIPMIIVIGTNAIQMITGGVGRFYEKNDYVIIGLQNGNWAWEIMFVIDLAVCAIILVDFFFLFQKDIIGFFISSGAFLIGLMSKAMIGFSPTIWDSYERTGWVASFILMIPSLVIIKKFEEKDCLYLTKGMAIALCYMTGAFVLWNTIHGFAYSV